MLQGRRQARVTKLGLVGGVWSVGDFLDFAFGVGVVGAKWGSGIVGCAPVGARLAA